MTKARTHAQRIAAKKRARLVTLSDGTQIPMKRQGLPRLHAPAHDDSPPPIFEARKRMCAIQPDDPLHESDMGRCILALSTGDTLRTLRDAWGALSAARANFRTRIIGQTGNPQGAAIAMLPDATETDPSLRVDLRTADERDRDAKRHWAEWEARLKRLPTPMHRWAVRNALDGFINEGSLWQDGMPTPVGINAVQALRIMADDMSRA